MKLKIRIAYLAVMALLAAAAVEQRVNARVVVPSEAREASPVSPTVSRPSLPGPSLTLGMTGALLIPVLGISRHDLRDNWGEARGGGSRNHTAIDILAPRGTPAVASVKGTIIKLHESRAGGLTLYLLDESRSLIYYYAHLDAYAPNAREGRVIEQGEIVGYVGTSGNAPPGTPHLHFGIERMPATGEWWKGEPMNPYPILYERGVTMLEALR